MTYTNEIIDKFLNNRNIVRIGDYKGSKVKISFKCLIDNHIWETRPDIVLMSKNGCPKCCNKIRITNKSIDNEIKEKNLSLIRIGNYERDKQKLIFQCTDCNKEFLTRWDILKNGSGCPNCFGSKEERHFKKFIYNNLKFDYFQYHKNFRINGKRIIPDFYIEKRNRKIIIEYNGIQHYKPVKHFGGEDTFNKQKERDDLIKTFCNSNNFEYYELPYNLSREVNEKFLLETLGGT